MPRAPARFSQQIRPLYGSAALFQASGLTDWAWRITDLKRVHIPDLRPPIPGLRPQSSELFSYSAVTTVLIPPRTEKSPTTVMRRG